MPFEIIRNDITRMPVDIIVNAANTGLQMGGGVCGAIFAAAGADKLQAECDRIGGCDVGAAVITGGYRLPAKQIIHTVGPIWQGGGANEAKLLHNAYTSSLNLALKHACKSIAFPLISSGIYGYPKDQALKIAVSAISEFLLMYEMMVYLVVFDKKAFAFSEKLFSDIEKYIDDHYVEEHLVSERHLEAEEYEARNLKEVKMIYPAPQRQPMTPSPQPMVSRSLEDVLGHLDDSFSEMLIRLIDEKGMTDVET